MRITRITKEYFYRVMHFDPIKAKITYSHNFDLTRSRMDYLESISSISILISNTANSMLRSYYVDCKKDIEMHGIKLCVEEVLSAAKVK